MNSLIFNKKENKIPEIIKYKKRVIGEALDKRAENLTYDLFKSIVTDLKHLSIYRFDVTRENLKYIDLTDDLFIFNRILSTIDAFEQKVPDEYKDKISTIYIHLERSKVMFDKIRRKKNIMKYIPLIKKMKMTIRNIIDYASVNGFN